MYEFHSSLHSIQEYTFFFMLPNKVSLSVLCAHHKSFVEQKIRRLTGDISRRRISIIKGYSFASVREEQTPLGNRLGSHLNSPRVNSCGIEIESHVRIKDSTTNTTNRNVVNKWKKDIRE